MLEASAIIAGKHSRAAITAEFSDGLPDAPPIDLSTIAPGDLDNHLGRRVQPTPAIAKYIEGANAADLTPETLDHMVDAMNAAYGLKPPYGIFASLSDDHVNFCLDNNFTD